MTGKKPVSFTFIHFQSSLLYLHLLHLLLLMDGWVKKEEKEGRTDRGENANTYTCKAFALLKEAADLRDLIVTLPFRYTHKAQFFLAFFFKSLCCIKVSDCSSLLRLPVSQPVVVSGVLLCLFETLLLLYASPDLDSHTNTSMRRAQARSVMSWLQAALQRHLYHYHNFIINTNWVKQDLR